MFNIKIEMYNIYFFLLYHIMYIQSKPKQIPPIIAIKGFDAIAPIKTVFFLRIGYILFIAHKIDRIINAIGCSYKFSYFAYRTSVWTDSRRDNQYIYSHITLLINNV